MTQKLEKIITLTEQSYERLENSIALIKLLQQKDGLNKEGEIALNMVLSDIKSTIEIILEIQENIISQQY